VSIFPNAITTATNATPVHPTKILCFSLADIFKMFVVAVMYATKIQIGNVIKGMIGTFEASHNRNTIKARNNNP